MEFTREEVMMYVDQEDVKFIRLAFCDVFGRHKNIAIQPSELEKAFEFGIAIDASAIAGFGGEVHSDVFLHPDPSTLTSLPWRSENGRVVRMFCNVTYPDGTPLESDSRHILQKAVSEAKKKGLEFSFGAELEFYLFKTDENGEPTKIPYDNAGYLDIAPDDKGENIRREICLTLAQMGVKPEHSHHEEGPGQNEIDFHYTDAVTAADNVITCRSVIKTIAARYGLCADFSPRPLANRPGTGMHINISTEGERFEEIMPHLIAGVMNRIEEMTLFLNPVDNSYDRLGSSGKAPAYISWSAQNRSQLIRIPATPGSSPRFELRSPDGMTNPYLAYALIIYAGLEGLKEKMPLCPGADINFYTASREVLEGFKRLPGSLNEARAYAAKSTFIKDMMGEAIMASYLGEN